MSTETFLPGDLLTVREVAAVLRLSPDAVYKRFASLPGVIDLGSQETRRKRGYKILRVPRSVLNRFLLENRV